MILSAIVILPLESFLIFLTEILTEEQKKEELEKLYSAIGYSEGEVITAFPKEVDPIFS